jgi:hypothetical protein
MSSSLQLPSDHKYIDGRKCAHCSEFKLAKEYRLEKEPRCRGGVSMRSVCRPCDDVRRWKGDIKYRYGISHDEYVALLEKQNGACAICGITTSNNSRTSGRLFVDHCHSSKKVRGLLCSRCNHALGQFDDDIDRLRSAIDYLKRNSHV